MLKKIWLHFKLVTKHKWIVLKLCIKAGIPWRGLVHDLSKYSFSELIESSRNYVGNKSAVAVARDKKDYSTAWLHHKGRNKHHEEYWYDWYAKVKAPIIPYKYAVEMICDSVSAGKVYKGEEWNKEWPLKYFIEVKNKELFHPKMINFLTSVYVQIAEEGLDKTINKRNLKQKYKIYCYSKYVN